MQQLSCDLCRFGMNRVRLLASIKSLSMRRNSYPLSYNQLALWRVYQLAPKSTAYNIYSSVKIRSPLNLNVWKDAWSQVIQRHGIMRTTYTTYRRQPIQVVHPTQRFEPEIVNVSSHSKHQLDNTIIKSAERPFDLENGPILRISLFQQSDRAYIQLLTIHEIAGEMRSLNILIQEFQLFYGQFIQVAPRRQIQEKSLLSA